jgi:ribose 5-phosphate isomerase A
LKPEQVEEIKRKAALEAVKHVKDHAVVGLGSGSTAAFAIEAIGERIKRENLSVKGIPTSTQAFLLAVKHGIPVTTLEEHPEINVAIDGVDQVDADLNLIGVWCGVMRGENSGFCIRMNVIIGDVGKRVKVLRKWPCWSFAIAEKVVQQRIVKLGGKPVLRREGSRSA